MRKLKLKILYLLYIMDQMVSICDIEIENSKVASKFRFSEIMSVDIEKY